MEIDVKDIILLLAGAIVALPITAGWQSTKDWFARRGQQASEFEHAWQARLKSGDVGEQRKAVQEIIARAFNHFVLGNVMFAAASIGATAIVALLGIDATSASAQMWVAAAFSFAALLYFSASMRWVRRLLRSLR